MTSDELDHPEFKIHKQKDIEDCPVAAENHANGWRPVFRFEALENDDTDKKQILFHVCGEKTVWDLIKAIRILSKELDELIAEQVKEDEQASDEGDGK